MHSFLIALVATAFSLPSALSSGAPDELAALCESPAVLSEFYVGENNDVQMTAYSCANAVGGGNSTQASTHSARADDSESSLTKKGYTNVCGGQCTSRVSSFRYAVEADVVSLAGTTHCFNPSGGGPDPNECHVISDALRYNSQAIGNVFNIPRDATVVRVLYRSCYSFFVNQATVDLQYCRQDWVSLIRVSFSMMWLTYVYRLLSLTTSPSTAKLNRTLTVGTASRAAASGSFSESSSRQPHMYSFTDVVQGPALLNTRGVVRPNGARFVGFSCFGRRIIYTFCLTAENRDSLTDRSA